MNYNTNFTNEHIITPHKETSNEKHMRETKQINRPIINSFL